MFRRCPHEIREVREGCWIATVDYRFRCTCPDRADRKAEDYVRMDSLPSAPIPEGVDTAYPVWAVDKHGMALVGPGADEVESVEEVRAACEELARRMRGTPLRCHKCGHIWTYRGRSQYRTTCPACHVTVYLDKCKIVRGGIEAAKRRTREVVGELVEE